MLNIFTGMVLYKTVYEHFDFKEMRSFAMWIYWLLVVNLLVSFGQVTCNDPIYSHVSEICWADGTGFFKLKATMGIFVSAVSPLLAYLSPWLLILTIPIHFYAQSSVAMGALVLSMGIIAYMRMPRLWFYLIASVLLTAGVAYVFIYDMPGGQFGKRFEIWFISVSHALKISPFFGMGIGKFALFSPMSSAVNNDGTRLQWIWMHNEYLQMFFETGLIGLGVVFFYIKARCSDFLKVCNDRKAVYLFGSFVAVLCVSFLQFPFHIARTAFTFICLMALYHARSHEIKEIQ